MAEECAELERFVRGELDPGGFSHREHLRMAFELLRRRGFLEAALEYSQALRAMTMRACKPELFNQTMTIAFLALLAERMGEREYRDFAQFVSLNSDLLDKSLLRRWYSPQRLASHIARNSFVLPEPLARAPGS
jgi:hypothetical protein